MMMFGAFLVVSAGRLERAGGRCDARRAMSRRARRAMGVVPEGVRVRDCKTQAIVQMKEHCGVD